MNSKSKTGSEIVTGMPIERLLAGAHRNSAGNRGENV